MKNSRLSRIFLLIGVLLMSQLGLAATIKGKVTDAKNGEELIGATVLVQGTNYGGATDIYGNYQIDNLPAGEYKLVCRYVSYENKTVEKVIIVHLSDTKNIDISLLPKVMGIKGVEIKARMQTKSENAVLSLQSKAPTSIDALSAEQMSRNGDANAASALKRVPGVNIVGGRYVYVRGLGDRYSKTEINGVEIPGLDPEKNAVQLDLFTSHIIQSMVVHKTYSPDLPASFTGGYVNILTKEFPDDFSLMLSTSFGYSEQASLNKNFLSYQGGKNDWLGYDDGFRALPFDAETSVPGLHANNDLLDQQTRAFNKVMAPQYQTSFLNHSHNFAIGDQLMLFGKPLGYIASLSYKRSYKADQAGESGWYKLTGASSESLNKEEQLFDQQGQMNVLTGALFNLNYKISDNHKLSLNFITNHSGIKSAWSQQGVKPSDNAEMIYQKRSMRFVERGFSSTQLKGNHTLPKLFNTSVNWHSALTFSNQDEPDFRIFNSDYEIADNGDSIFNINEALYPAPTRYYRSMEELNLNQKLDVKIPLKTEDDVVKAFVKFGGAVVYKDRSFRDKRYLYSSSNNSYNGNINDYLSDNNLGQNAASWANDQKYGVYIIDVSEDKNTYDGSQFIGAAYALIELDFGRHWHLQTGGRFERTVIRVQSKDPLKTPGKLIENDFLPALNLSYKLSSKSKVRFAATRTLARPTFRELAPYDTYNMMRNAKEIGNPELQRTLVENIDLRFEHFPRLGEIVSVSAFYKHFTNPIEVTDNPIAVNAEFTWQNVDKAKLFGFEFDFRKQLDFIDASLRNFKFGMNLTWVYSAVDIDSLELKAIHAIDPGYGNHRQLMNQSPWLVNASLNYTNNAKKLNASLAFNVTGPKLNLVIKGGTPDVYEQPFASLNFNINKQVGKHFNVKAGVSNLLNSRTQLIYTYQQKDYTFKDYGFGRTWSLGVSYLFNKG